MAGVSEELLRVIPRLWRGSRLPASWRTVPTGFVDLDRRLSGGGWPLGAVVELLAATVGIGELRLLLPLIGRLSRSGNHVLFVDPPHRLNAVALHAAGVDPDRLLALHPSRLRDTLWAAEQALHNAACGAVLLWPREERGLNDTHIRRLQLAAQEGQSMLFLYRTVADRCSSHAMLRLELLPAKAGLQLNVLKAAGMRASGLVIRDSSFGGC